MPEAALIPLGIAGMVGSTGLGAAQVGLGIDAQNKAREFNANQQKIAAENQKKALAAAKITGNILSQDYINNVMAPSLGYNAKTWGQPPEKPITPGMTTGQAYAPPAPTPAPVPPISPGMTPGQVKKPQEY